VAALRKDAQNCKVFLIFVCIFIPGLLCVTGCGPTLSSDEEVRKFEQVGTIPEADVNDVTISKFHTGPYRVTPGDLLELQIPAILRVVSAELSDLLQADLVKEIKPYSCRVTDAGTIVLPIVGEITVAGKTVAEIESSVKDAYYPKYAVNPPMVVCKVAEYQNESERVFTVMGLVNRPDAYPYPPDVQYNLMEALAFAGGFNLVADPRYLEIYRQDSSGEIVSAVFSINNKSLADAYNVVIKPGDVIYVDHTFRTRTNTFLSNVFSIGAGADVRYSPGR